MENVIKNDTPAVSTGKIVNIVVWVLQIGAAFMFIMAGWKKLSGDPMMVGLFDKLAIGQWFRYLTGAMEVGGAILLLIPRLSGVGATILIPVMLGAIATHLFIIGGSPLTPIILLVAVAVVAWVRRERTMSLFSRQL